MWQRDGTRLALDDGKFSAQLDLAFPQHGINNLAVVGPRERKAMLSSRLLQVLLASPEPPESISDSWVRGDDVVAVYSQTDRRPFRPEVYWRRLPPASFELGVMELVVSVQTNLLDATPSLSTASELLAEEALWLADPGSTREVQSLPAGSHSFVATEATGYGMFVVRMADAPISYVEMIYPSDFSSVTLDWGNGTAKMNWRILPESLEKGVIRRVRLRGVLLPREADVASAGRSFREFLASPPPLTT